MQIIGSKSISEALGNELARRIQRNSSYSLRAFARDLKLSPSRLSEVMKGRNGLSEKSLDSIVTNVTKKIREQNYLRDMVLAEFARNKNVRELAQKRIQAIQKLDLMRRLEADEFAFVSQWYHGAILELVELPEFKYDVQWISQRIGILPSLVMPALERLAKLDFIRKNAQQKWECNPQPAHAFSSVPSLAVRKYHQQILSMHISSLLEDSMEEREHLSTIMAIPRARLPELKEELRKFQFQFWQKIADDPKDDIYSFSIQFCPIKNRRPQGGSHE